MEQNFSIRRDGGNIRDFAKQEGQGTFGTKMRVFYVMKYHRIIQAAQDMSKGDDP